MKKGVVSSPHASVQSVFTLTIRDYNGDDGLEGMDALHPCTRYSSNTPHRPTVYFNLALGRRKE